MRRRMEITVVNTGIAEKWQLSREHLEHGKWMDGSPPKYVENNSTREVRSEKQTGAAYGTTGSITFTSSIRAGSILVITWNKPYGTDATTCEADMNSVDYSAKVANKNFQTSEAFCDVVISVKTKPVIDTKSWMSRLPASTTLNNIVMPGSHDAGMSELHHCSVGASDANTQTQQLDIRGQLEAGSRYFDVRVDFDHDQLVTYHRSGGLGCNGQTFEAVLQQMTAFLQQYKTETAILKLSHVRDDSGTTKKKIEEMLLSSKFAPYLYKSDDNANLAHVSLGRAAAKLIVVLDYADGVNPSNGLFRYRDGFLGTDQVCSYRGLNVTVCDLYTGTDSYGTMSNDQIGKWDSYAGLGKDYLFLLSWTLTAGALGSIRDLAREANGHLPNVLRNQIEARWGKPNIVYIDFVNVETARAIIECNFA